MGGSGTVAQDAANSGGSLAPAASVKKTRGAHEISQWFDIPGYPAAMRPVHLFLPGVLVLQLEISVEK